MARSALAAILLFAWSGQASAQTYPDRPVKFVVPYAPGGVTDGQARVVAAALSVSLGQQVIIENKPGASGTLAIEMVKKSPPDGYTFLVFALSQAALLPAMSKIQFVPLKDYAPVSNFGYSPQVLAVSPAIPVNTPGELVEWAKKQDNPTFAAAGHGTTGHLSMVSFMQRTGMKLAAVNMRGGMEQINAVMAGHIPMAFVNASDVIQQAAGGTVKILAVTSTARIPQLPDVPTMIEAGYKDFVMVTWNGLAAPVDTPKPIVDKVSAAIHDALQEPKIQKLFEALVVTPVGSDPDTFAKEIVTDMKVWGDVVRAAGMDKSTTQ